MNIMGKTPKIVVIGSSNTDLVVQTAQIPKPGETVLGGSFMMNPGGKGANQAVAAARMGASVGLICKLGDDWFGRQALKLFRKEGIDTRHIRTDAQKPSGIALITVDRQGENCIVVAPGANESLMPSDLDQAIPLLEGAGFLLLQLEIPMETVEYAGELAGRLGLTLILNPAPARELRDGLLRRTSLIVPNETEAEYLTGVSITDLRSAGMAAQLLAARGVATVILTLGAKGALICQQGILTQVAAPQVTAVDSTAAGDVFTGSLAAGLSEGLDLEEAVRLACRAAAISVTRRGAQSSAPFRRELEPLKDQEPQR
jgi:ribokinase